MLDNKLQGDNMNRTKYSINDYRRYGNNPNAPLLEAKCAAFALTEMQLVTLQEHCAELIRNKNGEPCRAK